MFGKRKINFWLGSIILLAVILRFWQLGSAGMVFFRDEAALGYNAYSLVQTARDEFGQFLPVIFRSFEVFFLPAYVYLSVPVIWLLGLSPFSTRFLSALAGVAAVILIYLLAQRVEKRSSVFPLLAALFLTIAPWHFFYSRGAFEGNLALTFFTAGVLLFVWRRWSLSLIFFVLSMYSYQSERLVVPLWLAINFWFYRRYLPLGWRRRLKLVLPAVIIGLPLLFIWFSPAGLHRASGVSLLSPTGNVERTVGAVTYKILAMYTHYFSPRNLFFEGDYDRQRSLVGLSVFYWWWVVGWGYGVYKIWAQKKKPWWFLTWWLLGPLPAALTPDPFHTYRSLLFYLPNTILVAYGFWLIVNGKLWRWIVLGGVTLLSVGQLWGSYFYLTPFERGWFWDQPFKETAVEVARLTKTEKKIVWDTSYSEPYIHYLFWNRYDPAKLQAVTRQLALNYYGSVERVRFTNIDNVYFEEVDWPTRRGDADTVFVLPDREVPPSEFATDPKVKLLKTVSLPNGEVLLRFLKILN